MIASRRRLIGGSFASLGLVVLAACSSAAPAAPTAAPAATAASAPTTAPAATAAPATAASTAAPAATAASAATSAPAQASATAAPAATKPAAASPASTAAPQGTAATSSQSSGKQILWGSSRDISTLSPHYSTSIPDIYMFDLLYDQLVHRDPVTGNFIPGMATEWKLTNDTTWQFKLRPGLKFHDGSPVTSGDVKFSIEHTFDPAAKTLVATVYSSVAKVDAVDDLTVNFTTKGTDPLLPARLTTWGGQVMPAKYFQEVGADGFLKKPIGTGPFKFVEWVKADHVTFTANPDYWEKKSPADGVVFKPRAEDAARVAALLSGEVNFIDFVTPDLAAKINASSNAKTVDSLYAGLQVLVINNKVPPLDKAPIRQALNIGIDRATLLKTLLQGAGAVPNGSIVPGDFGYDANRPPLPYDPAKAKTLLQQGGYKGETIFFEALATDMPLAQAIVQMWQGAGLTAQAEVLENAVRAQKVASRTFKGVATGLAGSPLGDPDGHMVRLLGPGGLYDYVRDPEWDKLAVDERQQTDAAKRKQDFDQMQDNMLQQVQWIPLFQPKRIWGTSKSLNWKPNPNDRIDFTQSNLSFTG